MATKEIGAHLTHLTKILQGRKRGHSGDRCGSLSLLFQRPVVVVTALRSAMAFRPRPHHGTISMFEEVQAGTW